MTQDAAAQQISALSLSEIPIIAELSGPNGIAYGPDGPDPDLIAALTKLETAQVDVTTLSEGQTVASIEAQTLTDLETLSATATTLLRAASQGELGDAGRIGLLFPLHDFQTVEAAAVVRDAKQFLPDNAPPMSLLQPPPAPTDGTERYLETDATKGVTQWLGGQRYTGPVAGITNQFVDLTGDSLNITATAPNNFIQVGGQGLRNPATAGINVSQSNGTNVLDSYANSSFLSDGAGIDQNYLDARGLSQNMWSTVVNFGTGDNVTVWGVTAADFKLQWIGDAQGAAGATGLTGVFVPNKAGQPEAAVTLAGFKMADLTSGRLTISDNTINGIPYASIHAN